ncbi:MAG: hypothetical protein H0X30_13610, partial [Anaerolineae bacterium]|nr:hypothetical protein [Anaerolineae bacterium]
ASTTPCGDGYAATDSASADGYTTNRRSSNCNSHADDYSNALIESD